MKIVRYLGAPVLVAFASLSVQGCNAPTNLESGCRGNLCDLSTSVLVVVTGTGTGAGQVMAPDPAVVIDCAWDGREDDELTGDCEHEFADLGAGGSFLLIATPVAGSTFEGWTGDCSHTDPTCRLSFNVGQGEVRFDVEATFDEVVPNQSPSATIESPSSGGSVDGDATITFQGSAQDAEDGALTGDALQWTIGQTGATPVSIGSGTEFSRTLGAFSGASYFVVLTATDSQGATAVDSISIRVN